MLVIRIGHGNEVLATIERELAERGVTHAAVVSVIGVVESCRVSTMRRDNAREDVEHDYTEFLEVSGNGEVNDGAVHLHVVLGAEGNRAIAGHLCRATAAAFGINAYVQPIE